MSGVGGGVGWGHSMKYVLFATTKEIIFTLIPIVISAP